jgi:hypothetical protein
MSHTPNFRASLWLAIPFLAVAGQLAMAANHAPVLNASMLRLTLFETEMGSQSRII